VGSTALAGSASAAPADSPDTRAPNDAAAWRQAGRILARVKPPKFRDQTFLITNYGAVNDGSTKATDAITKAITACNAAGGGHVVVPAGTFLTGGIHLLSNVDLHLDKGATLQSGSGRLPTRRIHALAAHRRRGCSRGLKPPVSSSDLVM